jgi:hypothetical protein
MTEFKIIDDYQILLTISTNLSPPYNIQTIDRIRFSVFIWDREEFLKINSTQSDFLITPQI